MTGIISSVEEEHIQYLAENMREADKEEIMRFGYMSPYEAVKYSVDHSIECYSWTVDGKVGCIWGVTKVSALDTRVLPWLLSTHIVDAHPLAFLKGSKLLVKEFVKKYDMLLSFVDAKYIKAINWIKWMGFEVGEPIPLGPNDALFRPFSMGNQT